jgi:hypothetical protein
LAIRKIVRYVKSLMRKPGRSTLLMAIDPRTEWGPDLYIAARISDALELSNYLFLQANSEDSTSIPAPEPIKRPGEHEADEPSESSLEFASGPEVADFFNRMSNL